MATDLKHFLETKHITALIDGDLWIYRASTMNEYECQWDENLWTLHSELEPCIAQLDHMIEELKQGTQADRVVMALTDTSNWRKEVMPEYKEHRKRTRKPIVYQAMREYVSEKYETFQRPTLEGDDILGILATHPKLIPGSKIIVSFDKDLKTIPGWQLDVESGDMALVDPAAADRMHMMQTLTGDQVDGYPGCPGFGPVSAERLLAEGLVLEPQEKIISRGPRKGQKETEWVPGKPGTPWEIVVSAYKSKGLNEEAALQNARVARICRAEDYDFKQKRVRLWNPPK